MGVMYRYRRYAWIVWRTFNVYERRRYLEMGEKEMIIEKVKKCEINGCDRVATIFIRDIKELAPDSPHVWKEYAPTGRVHPFCDIHQRDSVVYYN